MGKIRKPILEHLTNSENIGSYIDFGFDNSCYYVSRMNDETTIILSDEFKPLAEYLLKCDAYLKQQKKEKKK